MRRGCFSGPLRGILGAFWKPLGPSWAPLGAILEDIDQNRGGASIKAPPPWEPQKSALGALLGRSWNALGCARGRLGALSSLSWDPLGPYWSHLGASVGHRKRTGDDAEIIALPQVFERCWPLRGLLGGALRPLGATHSVAAYMAGAAAEKKNAFARLSHGLRPRPPRTKLLPPMLAP